MDPTTRICRVAPAKLNLALHVRGKRADGYHELDSVFVHCVDGDELWVEPAHDVSLAITGPWAGGLSADEDNLVLRAARGVAQVFAAEMPERAGAAITLVKNLPLASGIGGGSADAAATIHLLTALWDLPDEHDRTVSIAAALGSDVPPCLYPWPKHVSGRGVEFTALHDPAYRCWPVLLVNPGTALSTAEIFARWDGVDRGALPDVGFREVMTTGRNDLERPARQIAPVIGEVIAALAAQPGAFAARMSGSGATCFALFGSAAERDQAQAAIQTSHPNWWTMATRLA